jgi:hypothetical protein
MNVRTAIFLAAALSAAPAFVQAQKSTPDLPSPTKRQSAVDAAKRLARPPAPEKLPEDLPHPFNPEGFDGPVAPPPGTAKAGPVAPGGATPPAPPAGPISDREIIETLATHLPNASFVRLAGKSYLLMEKSRLEVGTVFTVPYKGQDYELELTAINNTSFTLKYHNEEFTRPNRITR